MSPADTPGTPKTLAWLLGGLLTGVSATAGVTYLVTSWIQDGTPAEASGAPLFEDLGSSAGVDHVYDGEFHFFVGGGIAVFDCNNDRLADLYVAGGSAPAGLYVNESEVGGSLAFSPRPGEETDLSEVTGAYPIDIDSDGMIDLAVLRLGENVILRGTGECHFERANESWNVDGGDDWTVAFSAYWKDGDSWPTLAFGNYLRLKQSGERDECEDSYLIRPTDVSYAQPEKLAPGYCTLSILFSDWDRSGTPDLRMTNDRHYYTDGQEQLWNMSGGTPEQYTNADGWQELEIWGMGIASHDLDEDGLPEVFLTSQGDNKLQSLAKGPEQPMYEDLALAAGVTAHRPFTGDTLRPSTAWHAEFDDVNNDGFMDLFVTKGNVDAQVDFTLEDPNNLLLGQPDRTFVEVADVAGLLDYHRSRGAAVVDLDLDGLLDIVVVERREPVRVWRNTGQVMARGDALGNWLQIDVGQPGWNRDAVGGWIEVEIGNRTITREITIGGGHASGELGWFHFGLGPSDEAKVRVLWPDGGASRWETLRANERVVWDRESGPTVWTSSRD
jgi:hypothetical protein